MNGITRQRLIKLVSSLGFEIKEQPFTLSETLKAEEAFLSSSISGIGPVVHLDNHKIGLGQAGEIMSQLIKS
ncbi:aminotransferase class IV [Candidatus Paracaedibacter symbiosus]|uniref:aminotransferase class IV n=1 Tax=Candidatus Paracaedibacter symbiosus TaxID=244582 RepID=UPI0005095F75|nr:aminotransferase class IV [Candidatus Paracaedibacter symbiosus]